MTNYLSLEEKGAIDIYVCKFNVSIKQETQFLETLKGLFDMELLEPYINRKNMRERTRRVNVWETLKRLNHKVDGKGIEFKASTLKVEKLKKAFSSQLQILENPNP